MIDIVSGPNSLSYAGAGKTVADVRALFAAAFNIGATARPVVNDVAATETYVLQDGDELVFAKEVGEKG